MNLYDDKVIKSSPKVLHTSHATDSGPVIVLLLLLLLCVYQCSLAHLKLLGEVLGKLPCT